MKNRNNKYSDHQFSLKSLLSFSLLSCLVLGGTACSRSSGPTYYTLTPQGISSPITPYVRTIEVLPVNLPDRLNRPLLVITNEQGQSKFLDNKRWTSPLASELRDGLSSGLQTKLGAVDRYNSGIVGGQVAYRIATDFSRFDIVNNVKASSNNQYTVEVAASWIIKRIDPKQLTDKKNIQQLPPTRQQLNCRIAFTQPIATHTTTDMVEASRQALDQVANAISHSLIAIEKGTSIVQGMNCS